MAPVPDHSWGKPMPEPCDACGELADERRADSRGLQLCPDCYGPVDDGVPWLWRWFAVSLFKIAGLTVIVVVLIWLAM